LHWLSKLYIGTAEQLHTRSISGNHVYQHNSALTVFATPTNGTQTVSVQYRSPTNVSMRKTKGGSAARLVGKTAAVAFPLPHRLGATRSNR
jgi:hypothetical protein